MTGGEVCINALVILRYMEEENPVGKMVFIISNASSPVKLVGYSAVVKIFLRFVIFFTWSIKQTDNSENNA